VASLSQGRTAAAQCGLFTHKSVPVIFEPPCISTHKTSVTHKTILVCLRFVVCKPRWLLCCYVFIRM